MPVYFTNSDAKVEGNDKDIININMPNDSVFVSVHGSSNSPADNLKMIFGQFKHGFLGGNHFDTEGTEIVEERRDATNLEALLKAELDKDGYIVGGDWNPAANAPLTGPKTIDELKKLLGEDYQIEVTEDAVNRLKPTLKRRANSMYNQQVMKVETFDIALKDLVFKITRKTDKTAPSIPHVLLNKFAEIDAASKNAKKQLEALEAKGELTDAQIDQVCAQHGLRNYQNLSVSGGNDHQGTYFYDEQKDRVYYVVNSMKHTEYDFEKHFKDGKNINLADATQKYVALRHKVLVELYKVLAKRDEIAYSAEELNQKTDKELADFVDARKKANETNYRNKDKKAHAALSPEEQVKNCILSSEDFGSYFKAMLDSKELKDVNDLLKTPFDLKNPSFVQKKMNELNKMMSSFNESIAKLFNIFFQGLSPKMPQENEQAISLNGNGFKPFVDQHGNIVPISTVEQLQLIEVEADLDRIRKLHPTATFAVSVIEGSGQNEKCEAIASRVTQLNRSAEKIRTLLGTNFFAPATSSKAVNTAEPVVQLHV